MMTDGSTKRSGRGAGEPCPPPSSPRVRVRRKPYRARYDLQAVRAVLDAAPFCHVATVRDGRPVVLPMAHGRLGDRIVLHGSTAAGLFRDMTDGSPVCVAATLLDGLVFARSAFNHSMNYRSVVVHGHATRVTDPAQVIECLRVIVDHLAPGRWAELREPTEDELRQTGVWQVPIDEASVKARSGAPLDPKEDLSLPVWAGHVPAGLVFGRPVPAADMPSSIPLPGYVSALATVDSTASRLP